MLSIFSFGGGVQSTAALVLAAQGELDIKTFVFANVGDDSENPATIAYIRDFARRFALDHGIELIELHHLLKNGEEDTLYGHISNPAHKGEVIPMRIKSGAPGVRACTSSWKIKVIEKWVRANGATKDDPARVGLGISVDELQRMKASRSPYTINHWPLIDRRLSRQDCTNIINRAGLPVPPKSSCWFCPFHRMSAWQEMSESEPELFQRSVALEKSVNDRRLERGKPRVYLTGRGIPLDRAINQEYVNGRMFVSEEPTCDSGYCFM